VATGSPPFAFHGAENGSISRLVIHGEQMILRGFNDVSHLSV
jgi:probable phosphoglycerate mutase